MEAANSLPLAPPPPTQPIAAGETLAMIALTPFTPVFSKRHLPRGRGGGGGGVGSPTKLKTS